MPALLGERDEVLRAVEAAFPDVTMLVRGNEIALDGPDAERVGALFEDLVVLVEQGQRLDASTVRRSVDMVRHDERPSDVLTARGAPTGAGPSRPPEVERAEALRGRGARQRHHLRPRAGGHRQELAGRGHGRPGPAGQAGRPHHPHPPRSRGGGAARLPARRPHGQGGPVPAAAVGRPPRHGRRRGRRQAPRAGSRRGGTPRVHARAHAQRLVHHPGRGPEHHARADEDVPHADRLRLQGRHHR